jgi:hypothetical protein
MIWSEYLAERIWMSFGSSHYLLGKGSTSPTGNATSDASVSKLEVSVAQEVV